MLFSKSYDNALMSGLEAIEVAYCIIGTTWSGFVVSGRESLRFTNDCVTVSLDETEDIVSTSGNLLGEE